MQQRVLTLYCIALKFLEYNYLPMDYSTHQFHDECWIIVPYSTGHLVYELEQANLFAIQYE